MNDIFLNSPLLIIPRENFLLVPTNHTYEVHSTVLAYTNYGEVRKMENQTFRIKRKMPMYYVGNFTIDPDYGTTITKNFTWWLEINQSILTPAMKYEIHAYTS